MYDTFQTRKINNNLRSQTDFASNCVNTNKFGLNLLKYFASKVSVKIFKRKIRNWKPKDCYYYLCKTMLYSKKLSLYIIKVFVNIFGGNLIKYFVFCKC